MQTTQTTQTTQTVFGVLKIIWRNVSHRNLLSVFWKWTDLFVRSRKARGVSKLFKRKEKDSNESYKELIEEFSSHNNDQKVLSD